MRVGIVVFGVLHLAVVAQSRWENSLDFGWRFHLGDAANQDLCPSSAFTQNITGYRCDQWAHQSAYQITFEECRLYCCGEPTCAGYLYNGSWCLIGNSMSGCVVDHTESNLGEARAVPAQIVSPPQGGPQDVGFDDSSWQVVDVPHDFVVLQPPSAVNEWNHGYRAKNVSWYRQKFDLSEQPGIVHIEFEGVYRSSDFWLNGKYLGHHTSGYTTFRFRIDNHPAAVHGGQNLIALRVDPRANEGWWYEGGGIYRHVKLITTEPTHISPWSTHITSQITSSVKTPEITADASVSITTNITNLATTQGADSESVTITVISSVRDPTGKVVWTGISDSVELDVGEEKTVSVKFALASATLWHVGMRGRMYSLSQHVLDQSSKKTLDSVTTRFGIRDVVLDANLGLFVNNQSIKVQGMCNHQDFAGLGTALPARVNRFRVAKLQSFGVNAWRMSHNPPNVDLLEATDDLGMMVWDENRLFGDFDIWYQDLHDMVLRDRNHPSIIWWSLCNEFGCMQANMDVTISVGKKFRAILKSLDDRPISGAWNGDVDQGVLWATQVTDMMGINYAYQNYDPFHKLAPTIALISSESCSCTSDRNYEDEDLADGLVGPYHAWSCLRDCWEPVATRDFVMGSFDWTGFDYRGEETPTIWPTVNSHFGILDLAGFEKDAVAYYRGYFTNEATVHITPNTWNIDQVDPQINGTLASAVCVGTKLEVAQQLWKFDTTKSSSQLESLAVPGQCVHPFVTFSEFTVPCDASDERQFLTYNASTGNIAWGVGTSTPLCLDVFQGVGPSVGFYPCQGETDVGQQWNLIEVADQGLQIVSRLQLAGASDICLTYNDTSMVPVWVYTNGDMVEMYLNDSLAAVVPVAAFDKGTFSLPAKRGNLTAVAYKDGKIWATQTLLSTGSPAALKLELETLGFDSPLLADGQDAVMFTLSVTDSQSLHVPDAQNEVTVEVSGQGKLAGTGNGNPNDHSVTSSTVSLWNGLARIIVKTTTQPGEIVVRVSADGLEPASYALRSVGKKLIPRRN